MTAPCGRHRPLRILALPFDHSLTSVSGLRSLYREPSKPSPAKPIDHLDQHRRTFIDHSPLVPPGVGRFQRAYRCITRDRRQGFVRVLDDHRPAIPDLAGNNRLDSMSNLIDRPEVGLLFLIPRLVETLRADGTATITTDPRVMEACTDHDLRSRVAIGVDVEEVFIHCAKALRRSSLWEPKIWADLSAPTWTSGRSRLTWRSRIGRSPERWAESPDEVSPAIVHCGWDREPRVGGHARPAQERAAES